jgi:hypothetical protein
MADILKRLSGPTALTTSAVTQYTAPALTTTTIRNIHVANETGGAATFTLSLGTDGAGTRAFYQVSVAAGAVYDWSGILVLAAADLIQALASAGATLTLIVSGVETT